MAKQRASRRGLGQPPSEVQITVLPDPDARPLRDRFSQMRVDKRAGAIASLVLVAAAIAALVSLAPGSGGSGRVGAPLLSGAGSRAVGPAGIAAAYGYPTRCLSITIASSDPTFARADFDRSTPCGRYDGYATAIFHRLGGAWRAVLDATGYSCPVGTLPAVVQADLDVCALMVRSVTGRQ